MIGCEGYCKDVDGCCRGWAGNHGVGVTRFCDCGRNIGILFMAVEGFLHPAVCGGCIMSCGG